MPDERFARIHELIEPLRVKPGSRVRLPKDFDPGYTVPASSRRRRAKDLLKAGVEWLSEYQARLAAQDTWSLLVIFRRWTPPGRTARSGT